MNNKRSRILLLFAIFLWLALWRASTQTPMPEDNDMRRYDPVRVLLRDLVGRPGEVISPSQAQSLRDTLQQVNLAFGLYGSARGDAAQVKAAHTSVEFAMLRILSILELSALERIWLSQGATPRYSLHRGWPFGAGRVLLRIGRPGPESDVIPAFLSTSVDLSSSSSATIQVPDARTTYAVVSIDHAKPGTNLLPVSLAANGVELAKISLTIDVPAAGRVKITIMDETGRPTAAVAGFYSSDHRVAAPEQAISFDDGGIVYRSGRLRQYHASHYWPGASDERQVFFVDGGFSLQVPAGDYKLIVGKGFEYIPVTQTVRVQARADSIQAVTLKRWTNMPARGWYSGDGHVHYARADEAANQRLMTWAKAEDVHMINVMRMGDAVKTYFEQYAFGKSGTKTSADYALVPGQEDPRTSVIGHTLHMNLETPFRKPDQYYLYDLVFDEVHRQGGLSGYAHTYQPAVMGFYVRENMTINIPQNKIDFVELAQNGEIDDHQYYEFLNLGFKLPATGGSDVPWGHSIGTSRVYAYLGKPFGPQAWFDAVKKGSTFVTTGPMLELTVNGQVPGNEIQAKPGETLKVHAAAHGYNVPPRYIEVIAQGEVLRSLRQPAGKQNVAVDFTIPVQHSMWIGARCAGALTSPVYVRVGKEPFWKLKAIPELIDIRLKQLHDVQLLTQGVVPNGGEGGWNNPEGFQKQIPQLLERVEVARKIYLNMLGQAKAELSQQSTSP